MSLVENCPVPIELIAVGLLIVVVIVSCIQDSKRSKAAWAARPRRGDIYFGKPEGERHSLRVWVEGSYQMISGNRYVVFLWTSPTYQCADGHMHLADFVEAFIKVDEKENTANGPVQVPV